MELEPTSAVDAPSPICSATLRVHAFQAIGDGDREGRCRDCGLVMPVAAVLRDGPDARHCLACGWWSPEHDCAGANPWCVWCKKPFDD